MASPPTSRPRAAPPYTTQHSAQQPACTPRRPRPVPRSTPYTPRRPRPALTGAAAARRHARGSARRPPQRRWAPLRRSASTCPANLIPTLVICTVPAQLTSAHRRLHASHQSPPSSPQRPSCSHAARSGLGGPQAVGWLAYVRRVSPSSARNRLPEAAQKLKVSPNVPINLPAGHPKGHHHPSTNTIHTFINSAMKESVRRIALPRRCCSHLAVGLMSTRGPRSASPSSLFTTDPSAGQ